MQDLALRFRNTGWAFILGHELGHIRFQHKFYNEVLVPVAQANEAQADQFALELTRRVTEIPMGAMLFFQSGIYYLQNRADFDSDKQWQDYVTQVATHPLTAERLKLLSERVEALAPDFARGQPNTAAAREIVHFIGRRFAEFAQFLNDPLLQRVMKAKAQQSAPSSLAPRRKEETLRDFPSK